MSSNLTNDQNGFKDYIQMKKFKLNNLCQVHYLSEFLIPSTSEFAGLSRLVEGLKSNILLILL